MLLYKIYHDLIKMLDSIEFLIGMIISIIFD